MLEIRLRILDVRDRPSDPPSFLGIAEGFPEVLVHSTSAEGAEIDLVNALEEWLRRRMDSEATRVQLDDYPTVRVLRIGLGPSQA